MGGFEPIKAARMDWKTRTGIEAFKSYEIQLVSLYNKWLKQITVDQFEKTAELVFEEYKDQSYTYTRDLIRHLKKKGYTLLAISNSQMEIVSQIASHYGFDDCVGAVYERNGNHFTGKRILHLDDKDTVLEELIAKHHLDLKNSLAVGDSASDIPMLKLVQHPIAFNPEQRLFNESVKNGWKIVVERKNVIYELEPKHGTYVLAQTDR